MANSERWPKIYSGQNKKVAILKSGQNKKCKIIKSGQK